MCMQCLANADFVVASGILGTASARIGLRQRWPRRVRKMSNQEAAALLASPDPENHAPTAQVTADR
jgi:hypothetical protein